MQFKDFTGTPPVDDARPQGGAWQRALQRKNLRQRAKAQAQAQSQAIAPSAAMPVTGFGQYLQDQLQARYPQYAIQTQTPGVLPWVAAMRGQ